MGKVYGEFCNYFNPTFDQVKPCLSYIPQSDRCGFCSRPDLYRCHVDTSTIPLSHSSTQDFLTCHRLYYLKHIRGIRIRNSATSDPIKRGQLWDKVLQRHQGGEVDLAQVITDYEIPEREVAKVKALYRAFKTLEIQLTPGELQAKIDLAITFNDQYFRGTGLPLNLYIKGYYDRKLETGFAEGKLSGRPDNYFDIFFIQSQVGTYFLADPSLEYCIMEVVRVPDLKSTFKHKDEDIETYGQRCYDDIISRPSHYFIGWDREKKTFGRKFYRSEFNLQGIQDRFQHVMREIHDANMFQTHGIEAFYRNDKACNNVLPGIQCDMLGICRTEGKVSETQYEIRQDKGDEEEW